MSVTYLPPSVTIPHAEHSEPSADFTKAGGGSATRVLRCAWDDHPTLKDQVLGGVQIVGGDLIYRLPQRHPQYPQFGAVSCSVAPYGKRVGIGQSYTAPEALLTVQYEPDGVSIGGQTEEGPAPIAFIEETIQPTREMLNLPVRGLFWDEDLTDPIDDIEAPAAVRELETWQINFRVIPSVPNWVRELVGRTNDGPVFSQRLNRSYGAETLLFGAPTITNTTLTNGQRASAMQINITYKSSGWNKYYRASDPIPRFIYKSDGEIYRIHPPADFTQMTVNL